MRNLEIASIFNQTADLLEIQAANPFRVRAYRRAAQSLEDMTDQVEELAKRDALRDISGVGTDLGKKIIEYLQTGKMAFFEELKKQVPIGLVHVVAVPGIGPKTAKLIYETFGIASIDDLERIANGNQLLSIKGIKQKTIDNILKGIAIYRRKHSLFLLGRALPVAQRICGALAVESEIVAYGGSLRRMKETVHDVDILAASGNPESVMKAFLALPDIADVLGQGGTKASVRLHDDLQVDLRVVEPKCWGAALVYFTGSQTHNIRLRQRAIDLGLKLNEYGVFDSKDQFVAGRTEEDVYGALGMPWIAPALREDRGEIEAALAGQLPAVIQIGDIQGDLHMHTLWTDGAETVEGMARAAKARGYRYIAITDHSKSLGVAGGLSDEDLARHTSEIREVERAVKDLRILAGTEVDIRNDGTLDYPDDALAQLDFVVASVHSGFKQSRADLTARIVRAMENPYVRVIGHLTGRLIGDRDGYDIDLDEVMQAAARTRTCLEVNAHVHRLDLSDVLCRKARDMGVQLIVSTDAHNLENLDCMAYGVATAQRGWVERQHVLNSRSVDELLAYKARP